MTNNEAVIGKNYSEALFAVALEEQVLTEVYNELQELAQIYQDVPKLGLAFNNANISIDEQQKLLEQLAQPFMGIVQNFLKVVYKNQRMMELPIIITSFNELYNKHLGISEGSVISAVPLKSEQIATLEGETARILGLKQVKLNNICQKDVLGGFVIEVDNYVIDRSLRQRLNKLKQILTTT